MLLSFVAVGMALMYNVVDVITINHIKDVICIYICYTYTYIPHVKEAIYIRVNNPSLNKNIGKYHLPHIWDEVLSNITALKLK